MSNFNRVFLMGNMTRDPQLKFLPSQMAVAEFGIATNRKFKTQSGEDREEVTFVDCSAFGRTAEIINQYFSKGKPIFIEGRLKYDTWEDKNGGGKRSKMSVVVERFEFIGGRDGGGGGGGGRSAEQYDSDPSYDQGSPPQQQQRGPINRGPAPQRGPGGGGGAGPSRPAPQPAQQAEPPFGDDPKFTEEEIPF